MNLFEDFNMLWGAVANCKWLNNSNKLPNNDSLLQFSELAGKANNIRVIIIPRL